MKVYGHPLSTCTRKVLTVLAEKGAPFEFELVDLQKGAQKLPENLARQPFGRVPALEDDGFWLYESRAMARYLDDKLGGPSLTPSDSKGRAVMEQWISSEMSYFTPAAMKIVVEKLFKPMRGATPDEANVAAGREGVKQAAAVMERQLEKTPYIAGEGFTIADICFMPYLEYLEAVGEGALLDEFPKTKAWWGKIRGRDSWQKATAKA